MDKNQHINKTFLIILLGILAAIGPFSIDMYLPGFQSIAEDFYTDENKVAFTLTSYFVGIASGQLVYGPIVDKYGRKKPLLFGLSIYVLASIASALSTSIDMMILMRFLQALGACVGMVASTSIISDVYEPDKRARAFSLIMLVMGVAPLIAPSLGSFFLEYSDWRSIFYFLAVFAFAVINLIFFFLPETSRYMHNNPLKIKEIAKNYWGILQNKTFLYYTMAGSIAMSILFAYLASTSFIFITYFGLDNMTFSMIFAINASALIMGSYINGWLTKKFNYIKIGKIASMVLSISSVIVFIFMLFLPEISYEWVVVALFILLFNIGFINPNATAASLVPFTKRTGAASALGGSLRMGVAAVVAAIMGFYQAETHIFMFFSIMISSLLVMVFFWILPKRIKA